MRKSVRVFIMSLVFALPHAAFAQTVTVPPVPANIEVPEGNQAFLVGHAFGSQNYVCAPDPFVGRVAWALLHQRRKLLDEQSEQLITHFNSPFSNLSPRKSPASCAPRGKIHATRAGCGLRPDASSLDPAFVAPGAIPWVLLEVKGRATGPTGGSALIGTTFIHRLNTEGGAAPSTGCDNPQDLGRKAFVPYTANYFFYKKN